MNIGVRLAASRKAKGLSQRALAALAGVSNTTVARVEAGAVTPDTATIEKLAAALELRPRDLTGWPEPPLPPPHQNARAGEGREASPSAGQPLPAAPETDIRMIARKMNRLPPEKREMLLRMINAAFDEADAE